MIFCKDKQTKTIKNFLLENDRLKQELNMKGEGNVDITISTEVKYGKRFFKQREHQLTLFSKISVHDLHTVRRISHMCIICE